MLGEVVLAEGGCFGSDEFLAGGAVEGEDRAEVC